MSPPLLSFTTDSDTGPVPLTAETSTSATPDSNRSRSDTHSEPTARSPTVSGTFAPNPNPLPIQNPLANVANPANVVNVANNNPPLARMPARGHRTAPTFDGNPLNLKRFLDKVNLLAEDAGLDGAGQIRHSLRYASLMDHELWSGLASTQAGDWAVFRTDVMALYPGADDD